jgi:tetratricopeptide (TPR) repeat protein
MCIAARGRFRRLRVLLAVLLCGLVTLAALQATPAAAEATPSCAYAERLTSLGERTQAQEAFRGTLEAEPGSECAYRGLEGSTKKSFSEHFDHILSETGEWLKRVALALIALAIVTLLVLRLTRTSLPRPRLKVGDFGDSSESELNGVGMSAMLRTAIASEHTTRLRSVELVTSTSYTNESFSALGEVSSQIKTVLALLTLADQLVGRRRFSVAGQLLPEGPNGSGVSVALEYNGSYSANDNLWANDFGYANSHPYFQLVVPCSAWIQHQVASASDASYLPTRSGRSAAHLAAANEWQRDRNDPLAKQNYEKALTMDQGNTGALNNLALLAARDREYSKCLKYLALAISTLENRDGH